MRRRIAALSAILLLSACGKSGGEDATSETTQTTETTRSDTTTTTAPRTPEEAFLAGLEDRDVTFGEGYSPSRALEEAQKVCDALDLASRASDLSDDLATTPGAHDLDETIGNLGDTYSMVAEVEMDRLLAELGDETGAIVLDLMAEHLCPQHFVQ